jgi:lipoate-protein ligase A
VGYANKLVTEVNVAACDARRVPVLRRCSGGGTVVQGKGCLNYALVLAITADGPTHSISSANQFIMERNCEAIASAMVTNAAEIRIRGHTDLTLGDLKFSGNSQRRRKRHLLFHGTFLLDFDLALVSDLLPMPSAEPDYRKHRAHEKFIANLGVPSGAVKAAMGRTWQAHGTAMAPDGRVEQLVAERYSKPEWHRRF